MAKSSKSILPSDKKKVKYGAKYADPLRFAAMHIEQGLAMQDCYANNPACKKIFLPADLFRAPTRHRYEVGNALRKLAEELENSGTQGIEIALVEPNTTGGLSLPVFRDVLYTMRAVLV